MLCSCAVARSDCKAKCVDTIGSYKCQCSTGYQLVHRKICKDIDECESRGHGCQQLCINQIGGYSCRCNPGYWLRSDKKSCHDINECRRSNAGCEHTCTNIAGSYRCSCNNGYSLSYDGRACVDVNECLKEKPCDPRNGLCQNNPGGYKCSCKIGYSLKDDNKCKDVNECNSKNSCHQVCHNSIGSYFCDCKKGYLLSENGTTCTDIDECKNSLHECDQICINLPGAYKCKCHAGFKLHADKKACLATRCKTLKSPINGVVHCSGFTYNKTCTYTCNSGYQLIGSRIRRCQVSSRWTGIVGRCAPKPCPKLHPPLNGVLELPCVEEYKSKCNLKCRKGYVLEGNENVICGIRNGRVLWMDNNATCKDSELCHPNPCKNNGTCRIQPTSTYKCECSGTGYVGEHCETAVLSIQPYPPLVYGKLSDWIEIRGRPDADLLITPRAVNGDVMFIPEKLQIRFPMTRAKFKVKPRSSGLIRIRYKLSGTSANRILAIGDTIAYAAFTGSSENLNHIPDADFTQSQCYRLDLDQCPNNQKIKLLSSCPWKTSGALGYQSVSVGELKIPLSVAGVKFPDRGILYSMYARKGALAVGRELFQTLKAIPKFCSLEQSCKNSSHTAAEHRFLIKRNFFARSHIKALAIFLPKWMKVDLLLGYTGFHISNFQSMVLKGRNIRQLKTCTNLPLSLAPSIYAVQMLFMPVTLRLQGLGETIDSSSPTCLVTDICRMRTYFSLPSDKSVNLTPHLKLIGINHMQLQIFGFGFRKGSLPKPECIHMEDSLKECFERAMWLKVFFSIKLELVKVVAKGEVVLVSEFLDVVATERFTKPLKYIYNGEIRSYISIKAANKLITFVVEDSNGSAHGLFGLPRNLDKQYGLTLMTRSPVSTTHESDFVSFRPESSEGKFKSRVLYGLHGGKIDGIQNRNSLLAMLRRTAISLARILSLILRNFRRSRSVLRTEYLALTKFIEISKSLMKTTIAISSSPFGKYGTVYDHVLRVHSMAKHGHDIVDLLASRTPYLLKRRSVKMAIRSQLKVLKRSLERASQIQVIPQSTTIAETYAGVKVEYSGRLCFQALCFDNLDIVIDDKDASKQHESNLLVLAVFRKTLTLHGYFVVRRGAKLEATISKSSETFDLKIPVDTVLFGSKISTTLQLNQSKAFFILPSFKLGNEVYFDVKFKAKIVKTSTWQNTFFTISGSASNQSTTLNKFEELFEEYITTTSRIINARRKNASSLVNSISSSLQIMESERIMKKQLFLKAELTYEKMKSNYAAALTHLNTSLITFRSYRISEFFKNIENNLDKLYKFQDCINECLSVPIFCICQNTVSVDVNALACQLRERKVTTTIEKPFQTKCPITDYRFTPYYTGTCKRGKSRQLSGALGGIGAGFGGLIGGPVGAVVGGIVGGLFGSFFSSCSETYEVYKEVIHRQVDCTSRTFKPVTQHWKESVCVAITRRVVSGYDSPSECDCSSNNTCVIVQDPVCTQNNIRNVERRRIYVRRQMESAGKYNNSFNRLQDAELNATLTLDKLKIAERLYFATKHDLDKVEAKMRKARLELQFTNTSMVNFMENFALEQCISKIADIIRPVTVKNVVFDADSKVRKELLVKVGIESARVGILNEKLFLLDLGNLNVSLRNGIRRVAQEVFCSRTLRKRRSVYDSANHHEASKLFVQHTSDISQNMTYTDEMCIVSHTIFTFLQQSFSHLSKRIRDYEDKITRINSSIEVLELKLSYSNSAELKSQDNVLTSVLAQLKVDLKQNSVRELLNEWKSDMEIITGAANITRCLHFMDCLGESFRQLKDLPSITRTEGIGLSPIIEDAEATAMNLAFSNSFQNLSKAVSKARVLLQKIVELSAYCAKVPQLKLDKPSKIEAVIGTNVSIRCISKSDVQPVKYAWMFNDVTMLSEDNDKLELIIALSTQGTYKCIASTLIGYNVSEETIVIAREKPKFFSEPLDFRYYSSIPKQVVAHFACNVSSDPPALISWYYQSFQSGVGVPLAHYSSVLRIEQPNASDAGFYQCIAQNPFGVVKSRKARFDVLKSKPPFQKIGLSFDMPLGRSGAPDKSSIERKVVADGKLSSNQNVSVSYEFQSGRDVNVKISVTDNVKNSSPMQEMSEIAMLRLIMTSRRRLRTSIEGIMNGFKKSRGRSLASKLETSARLDFHGELCGPGYFIHENGFTCLQCPVGSFGKEGACELCSIGTYQDSPGKTFCHRCNASEVTKTIGAVGRQQCVMPELQISDIIFMLDSSSSIRRNNWKKVKRFLGKFVEEFVNEQNDLRIGVITYSSIARLRIPLRRYKIEQVKEEIERLPYYGGLTLTYRGIIRSLNEFQRHYVKGRRQLLFVMTDGQSTSAGGIPGFVLTRRAALRIQLAGVQVVSIGIGNQVDPAELKAIASFPKAENIIQYTSFDQLITASRRITATSLKGQCGLRSKDVAVVVEASNNISGRKWRKVQTFLYEFFVKLTSGVYKVSTAKFDKKVQLRRSFQEISSISTVKAIVSNITRSKAESSADYTEIVEYAYNHLFTEKTGSLLPSKILVFITRKNFDLKILNNISRSYPEEKITFLSVVMNLKSNHDHDGLPVFEDESSFTMAELSWLLSRIKADVSDAGCKSAGTESV